MAKFKASKKREIKKNEPQVVGNQLIPPAYIAKEYERGLKALMNQYMAVMRQALESAETQPNVEAFHSVGDSAWSDYKQRMNKVATDYKSVFIAQARALSEKLVANVNGVSKVNTDASLEKMGVQMIGRTPDLSTVMQAQVSENVRLITKMFDEDYTKIDSAVNLSLSSPHQGQQGQKGIFDTLMEVEGMHKSRAELIAKDQTAKVYTQLNTARMEDAGLETFRWIHSSAGKTPRPCHVDRDGELYLLKGGPNELYHVDGTDANNDAGCTKGDFGKPGAAINCRCRMQPVVSLDS